MQDTDLLKPKFSVYAEVTNRIVAAIEAGAGAYKKPWHSIGVANGLPTNASTHAEYRGVNVLTLWTEAMCKGYPAGLWASYRQWQSLGAQVRKGERGVLIVFYKRQETKASEPEDHDTNTDLRYIARASWVFNAAQVDGFKLADPEHHSTVEKCREAEAFVDAIGATIRHGYSMAAFRRSTDTIEMPEREWFTGTDTSSASEAYYGTLLHELTHWSGAPHRLNREFGKRFGDQAYAMEELVAELGAAFMCAAFGIASEPRPDHAAYIENWLQVLKVDNRAIVAAASKAQEAFEHLSYLATRIEPSGVSD